MKRPSIVVAGFWALIVCAGAAHAQVDETPCLAIFPVELWDTSGTVAPPHGVVEAERLGRATESLARTLEAEGVGRPVDLAMFDHKIAAAEPFYKCEGCYLPIAREAGARFAVVSTIHKASSLISTLDVAIVDVASGKVLAEGVSQFRGDGAEATERSINFLVKSRLLTDSARAALAH
ncbi:DUF3280 domain-containing protein [Methylocella sp.]|uniref:DUF3280 domain-containing protein n=1 Tax=Methylocella sp. TaxID=1978226 RepID=UPI00378377D6